MQSRGFTLVELLVVLVIIGVVISGALLAIGDPAADRLREENRRLASLIALSQEEAVLQSRELAISFWKNGYAFYELVEGQWLPLENDKVLRPRELPEQFLITLELEGLEVILQAIDEQKPQVFILSSGEISPFIIRLFFDDTFGIELSIDALGKITSNTLDEDVG